MMWKSHNPEFFGNLTLFLIQLVRESHNHTLRVEIILVRRGGLAPKKKLLQKRNCWPKKKKKSIRRAIARLPPPEQKISTNQAELKKKKRSWYWGAPDCLRGPQSRGARGIFTTSLYDQSAPARACCNHNCVCRYHTRECHNHTHTCQNHSLGVEITLVRVEITVVSVVISFASVKIRMRVEIWLSFYTCQNYSRVCRNRRVKYTFRVEIVRCM
jgi:hypothetical protein